MQEMRATAAESGETQAALEQFWPKVTEEIRTMSISDLKRQELPLARIKKIMKLDEDVKMISAEAPVLFGKACEMFIHELTMRAWVHTEDNKRRTLQRNDIAMAITKYDQFDFLIDIVPRDDIKPTAKREDSSVRVAPDQVSYYFQLAQQHQQSLQVSPHSSLRRLRSLTFSFLRTTVLLVLAAVVRPVSLRSSPSPSRSCRAASRPSQSTSSSPSQRLRSFSSSPSR